MEPHLITSFFLIFTGAAVLATLALFTRQPLLVAYIALGCLLGPFGTGWVSDAALLGEIAEIGIIFLLFLLGLDMQPDHLVTMLRKSLLVGVISSGIFLAFGVGVAHLFGFSFVESLVVGAALMFSSTIIGIKLLPTTVLHHKHTGEVVVSLLLLQDLLAIILLLVIAAVAPGESAAVDPAAAVADVAGAGEGWADVLRMLMPVLALPLLLGLAFLCVRHVLLPLIAKFDVFHEYIFLLAIGWCLGLAELANVMGLSLEIGAFIAGVTVATSPISQYIAESLRPLRDFFLILFFFSVGASLELPLLGAVAIPALLLAAGVLVLKPVVYRWLLESQKEDGVMSWEIGFRLGQTSEFSLLIAYLAASLSLIGSEASLLIQATTILTFLVSSYIVVLRFPTPIAISERLRRN